MNWLQSKLKHLDHDQFKFDLELAYSKIKDGDPGTFEDYIIDVLLQNLRTLGDTMEKLRATEVELYFLKWPDTSGQ